MTDPGEIIVTQRDRDAAADYRDHDAKSKGFVGCDPAILASIRNGDDDTALVQAFARHRTESTQAQAGEVGKLVEDVRDIAADCRHEGDREAERVLKRAAKTLLALQEQKVALVEALKKIANEADEPRKFWSLRIGEIARDALLVVEGGGK